MLTITSAVKFTLIFYLSQHLQRNEIAVYCQLQMRSTIFNDVRSRTELKDYSISSQLARDSKQCANFCHGTYKCQSFNFCGGNVCQLNYAAAGDVDGSSWELNEWCEYSGTPDDCVELDAGNETCSRDGCLVASHEFHWGHWYPAYEVSDKNNLLWNKIMVRDCLDGNNNEVMRSNCKGCYKKATNVQVLWVFTRRSWHDANTHCQQQGGILLGEFGENVKALMRKHVAITEHPFVGNTYYFTGVYQNGNKWTWISVETGNSVPFSDIFWFPNQPSNGNGAHFIVMNAEQFAVNSQQFMHDSRTDESRQSVCTIKT